MKKAVFAIAVVSVLAVEIAGAPSPAYARPTSGCAIESDVDAAIAGSALTGPRWGYAWWRYAPTPGYVVYSGSYRPQPVDCPGGYWTRLPILDKWGNQVCWSRPKFVCPY